jgi:prolyl-tRNA synthetase
MKQSKLFGKTSKGTIDAGKFVSNELLVRGGYIRESVAGRYFMLPLGWRVHEKIKKIIKEEMDKAGAQEMISPVLHPLELWKETNRTNTAGFELMKVKDRRGAEFALGGTAEEMFVDVVRKFQLSYRDLPFNIYQFSTKFRDELRARGGLLRVREFVMKDAYSFHEGKEDFEKEYEVMSETYRRIFERVGLTTHKVAADNGYIGGEYCHEYQVEHEDGEGRFFVSDDGAYIAHEDVATFALENKNLDEELKPYEEIDAERGKTMEDGVKLHGMPMWQQMKDVMYQDRDGKLYLAIIRGDLDVNQTKLEHLLDKVGQLEAATEEQVLSVGSYPGFIAPVGLDDAVTIVADSSIRTVHNFYGGANKKHKDALNINIDRDFKAHYEGDIAMAQDGFMSRDGHGVLHEKRGIEVGNIFQLGYHYSRLMKDATFTSQEGIPTHYYMGCYGIGLGRTMAAIVEKYHDEKGIIWPKNIAPFDVHLIEIKGEGSTEKAQSVYQRLSEAGVEVLWDDRESRAGEKFADSDLIGIPVRLVVSEKTREKVEWKERGGSDSELISVDELQSRLKK